MNVLARFLPVSSLSSVVERPHLLFCFPQPPSFTLLSFFLLWLFFFFVEFLLPGSCYLSLTYYHLEAKGGSVGVSGGEKIKNRLYSGQ